jgi:thiol-disulfide isomerase/thioredoxin
MRLDRVLLLTSALLWCSGVSAQARVERMRFDTLEDRFRNLPDSLVLLNFWATWCKPCIEELPHFDAAPGQHPGVPLKVVLVNLDFNSRVATLAEPFVQKRGVRSAVWHIDDTDPNTWINRIDSGWSGAIPATVFFRNGEKLLFHEGALEQDALDRLITGLHRP